MKFKLNDFNRNIPQEKLISDLQRVALKLDKSYVSRNEYLNNGRYSATPFINKFGTWIEALEAADLDTVRKRVDYLKISDEAIIKDMNIVARKINQKTITTGDYKKHGRYKVQTILTRYGNWSAALQKACLEQTSFKTITDTDLFKQIEKLWVCLGRQPTTTDIKDGKSSYSLNTYTRRFGGWRNALLAFLEYIENDNSEEVEQTTDDTCTKHINKTEKETDVNQETIGGRLRRKEAAYRHRTPRNINLRLRFKVLSRDSFKCCACGASPAKDPSVELHVDHKKPWSEGGETELDNLQTLCSKCNLGKSNLIMK